ncbi:unnamed protein product [Linum tenue]|uniref:Uncharacterized protein n=2 Tax=Linum tenue TaxID=586396 RepID=A0AAV0L5Z2_9ROSI|nr:unnamed protein product [Linum tenue]
MIDLQGASSSPAISCYLFLPLLFLSLTYLALKSTTSGRRKLPPSPPWGLPIVGHSGLMKPPIHRTLHALAQRHGPIFSLRLGTRLAVVVSSASLAEECFTKNDVAFANRPRLTMAKHIHYNYTTMTHAPYGDHWRNLRRIGAVEIFSAHRLAASLPIRRDEVRRLVAKLARRSDGGAAVVDMKSAFQELTFDTMMRMVAGKRFYGDDDEARGFREVIKEVVARGGATNRPDFGAVLRWIDGGKLERTAREVAGRTDSFMQKLIEEHRSEKKEGLEKRNTMIDHLLALQESEPEYYSDQIIKGLVLVMLLAGTDTSAVTLEWALANLLNHPNILAKAREELDKKIGQECLIDEPDISNLSYLQNIISETLRLYPAAPLLLPHASSEDCVVGGYHLPCDTILLVNAWAIHRDPGLWDDPTSFKPERYKNEGKESYKMVPFGLGRRSCPGVGLAQRIVGLTLGTLIQCFEWERVGEEEVDMTEGKGATMPREKPLEAICTSRPIVKNFFS